MNLITKGYFFEKLINLKKVMASIFLDIDYRSHPIIIYRPSFIVVFPRLIKWISGLPLLLRYLGFLCFLLFPALLQEDLG